MKKTHYHKLGSMAVYGCVWLCMAVRERREKERIYGSMAVRDPIQKVHFRPKSSLPHVYVPRAALSHYPYADLRCAAPYLHTCGSTRLFQGKILRI